MLSPFGSALGQSKLGRIIKAPVQHCCRDGCCNSIRGSTLLAADSFLLRSLLIHPAISGRPRLRPGMVSAQVPLRTFQPRPLSGSIPLTACFPSSGRTLGSISFPPRKIKPFQPVFISAVRSPGFRQPAPKEITVPFSCSPARPAHILPGYPQFWHSFLRRPQSRPHPAHSF